MVYRARDLKLGRSVAIKLLARHLMQRRQRRTERLYFGIALDGFENLIFAVSACLPSF